jgi:hypothetical protein
MAFDGRTTATIPQFERMSGLGRSLIYEMIADGRLETVRLSRRQLIILESFGRLVDQARAKPVGETKTAKPPVKRRIARATSADVA